MSSEELTVAHNQKNRYMSALEAYMKESGEMVSKLGFWSQEFKRFRDWWQQRGSSASKEEVEPMAARIWRESKGVGS